MPIRQCLDEMIKVQLPSASPTKKKTLVMHKSCYNGTSVLAVLKILKFNILNTLADK